MDSDSKRVSFDSTSSQDSQQEIINPSSTSNDYEFHESQCLFCNQTNPDLDQNMDHMLKAHGLYVDRANLLVDVGTLLAYFHLVISAYYECLYCGTQRHTRQAVQQHMMAKGHCKYDITDEDAELRDFYDFSSSDTKEKSLQDLSAKYSSDDHQLPSPARSRKPRPAKHPGRQSPDITASPLEQAATNSSPQPNNNADSSSNTTEPPSHSLGELSARAQKQEHTLNNQLARLRADERRSLVHLPASQQRAILATHHKQLEKARRTEQTNRSNLESAGNKFNRLGTVRLVRQPPHFGNVSGLSR